MNILKHEISMCQLQSEQVQANLFDCDERIKALKQERSGLEQQFIHLQGQIAAFQYVQKLEDENGSSETESVEPCVEASDTA